MIPPTHPLRRWLLPILVAALFIGAAIYFLIPPAPLDWSQRDAWKPKPVHPTDLKGSFGRTWRNLPFTLSPAEENAVNRCVALMRLNQSTIDGRTRFSETTVREQLESILREHPNLFYAQYMLAHWHKLHGEAAEAERYFKLAFHNAPVVLVQSYQFADGRPLAGAPVHTIEIECNRVENGSLNPDLKLVFATQVADDRGQIFLPVYDTVYRVSTLSHPDGYTLTAPRMGWFESGKLGLLPVATVTPSTATQPAASTPG